MDGPSPKNDIGIIKVDKAIPLAWEAPTTSLIVPICLPLKESDPGQNLAKDDQFIFIGWGKTTVITRKNVVEISKNLAENSAFSISPEKVSLSFIPNKECYFFNNDTSFNDNFCTSGSQGKF